MTRTTRENWAKRIERWQSSDLTANEFATEIGVNPRTLSYWKWVLQSESRMRKPSKGKARTARKAPAIHFEEVGVAALSEDAGVEIRASSGWSVRVSASFDDQALRRVLACIAGSAA